MMVNDISPLDTALELLRRGLWPVAIHPVGIEIPDKDGTKITTGKEPIGNAWGSKRPTVAKLSRTYGSNPRAGVGVRLGPEAGVIDIEVDGPDGAESLATLMGGEVVPTLGWSSRRGPHHLFRYNARLGRFGKSIIKLPGLPGLEIRIGNPGGQLQSVCPPTVGLDEVCRQWNGCDEIANLPEAAYAFLDRALPEKTIRPDAVASKSVQNARGEPASRRCGNRAAYGAEALRGECERVAGTTEGDRHNTLRSAALRIGALAKGGSLDWQHSKAALADAGDRCGLPSGEVQELLNYAWLHAEARVVHAGSNGTEDVSCMQAESSTPLLMHPLKDQEGENTIHEPKEEIMYGIPKGSIMYGIPADAQSCMAAEDSAQSCMARPDPQSCMAPLSLEVQQTAYKHAGFGAADGWKRAVFMLYRELHPIAVDRAWTQDTWKAVAAYWVDVRGGVCRVRGLDPDVPGFDSVWAEFKRVMKTPPKNRFGESLARAKAMVPDVEVPTELAGTKLEPCARALMSLSAEAERRGDSDFDAAYNKIGGLIGVIGDDKKVQREVRRISEKGYIDLLKAGQPGTAPGRMASTWSLWYSPPRVGQTVWNNNKAMKAARASQPAGSPVANGEAPTSTDPAEPDPLEASSCTADVVQDDDEDRTIVHPDAVPFAPSSFTSSLADEIADLIREAAERCPCDEVATRCPELGLTDPAPGTATDRRTGPAGSFYRVDDYDREERAAIMEFDGGLSRAAAELAAGLVPF